MKRPQRQAALAAGGVIRDAIAGNVERASDNEPAAPEPARKRQAPATTSHFNPPSTPKAGASSPARPNAPRAATGSKQAGKQGVALSGPQQAALRALGAEVLAHLQAIEAAHPLLAADFAQLPAHHAASPAHAMHLQHEGEPAAEALAQRVRDILGADALEAWLKSLDTVLRGMHFAADTDHINGVEYFGLERYRDYGHPTAGRDLSNLKKFNKVVGKLFDDLLDSWVAGLRAAGLLPLLPALPWPQLPTPDDHGELCSTEHDEVEEEEDQGVQPGTAAAAGADRAPRPTADWQQAFLKLVRTPRAGGARPEDALQLSEAERRGWLIVMARVYEMFSQARHDGPLVCDMVARTNVAHAHRVAGRYQAQLAQEMHALQAAMQQVQVLAST